MREFWIDLSSASSSLVVIPILHEDALNIKKWTAKYAKYAKEERGNYLVQVYRELVLQQTCLLE